MKAMRKPERPLLAADAKRRVIYTPAPHGHVPPAYAHEGVCHTPVPVFRWQLGQHIDQALSDLQYPLLERIIRQTPHSSTIVKMIDRNTFTSLLAIFPLRYFFI